MTDENNIPLKRSPAPMSEEDYKTSAEFTPEPEVAADVSGLTKPKSVVPDPQKPKKDSIVEVLKRQGKTPIAKLIARFGPQTLQRLDDLRSHGKVALHKKGNRFFYVAN